MAEDLALQLERDKQRLADWRSSPLKKGSIPKDIWDFILSYYPTLSVARICREFRIILSDDQAPHLYSSASAASHSLLTRSGIR